MSRKYSAEDVLAKLEEDEENEVYDPHKKLSWKVVTKNSLIWKILKTMHVKMVKKKFEKH